MSENHFFWPKSIIFQLISMKLNKSVENEQDFEFLAGMLLLRKVNGSSSFYKGPRTCKVWKSADPSGPWTFKLYLSLDLCKNYYSHLYFTVVFHCKPIPCNENRVFPVKFSHREIPVMKTGVPAMRTGVPCNENRFFPVWKTSQGKPCSGPVLALYGIAEL